MKRLLITALMLILIFLGTGCEKDEVVAPEGKDDAKQSVKVAAEEDSVKDDDARKEESETEDSTEKAESAKNSNEKGKATSPSEQTSTKTEPSSPQVKNNQNQSSQQETTKADKVKPSQSTNNDKSSQSTKTEKPKESTEKASPSQEKSSNTTTQKPTPEKSKEDAPPAPVKPSTAPEPTKPKETVSITIVAPGVKDTILPATSVEFEQGDTVLSITQKIVRARGIQISVTGASATAYVQGIDNLYEFDHGPLSGWEASVNGQGLDRSAGIYGVKPGQAIMWRYTKNYTE